MMRIVLLLIAALGGSLILSACASAPKVSVENHERIRQYWNLYLQGSPDWPEAREKWSAMGQAEEEILILWLIKELQRNAVKVTTSAAGKSEPAWYRPIRELKCLDQKAVAPSLLEALKVLRDETTVYACIQANAALVGTSDLLAAWDQAAEENNISYQSRLLKVLALIDDPKATERIIAALNNSENWQVRATAAGELGAYRGPMLAAVKTALEGALNDQDAFVASKAEEALAALKDQEGS